MPTNAETHQKLVGLEQHAKSKYDAKHAAFVENAAVAPGYAIQWADAMLTAHAEWQLYSLVLRTVQWEYDSGVAPDTLAIVRRYIAQTTNDLLIDVSSGESSSPYSRAVHHSTQCGKRDAVRTLRDLLPIEEIFPPPA
jgi:hypothetical protein